MAKTFYQYGKRDAIQYTDWSEISKNFSTMISDELTRREDKKAEIQKATDEAMKFINDNPVGTYSLANDFSIAHANNAQEYLLMLDKKLKSGALNPKDFVMMRENLKTGTEGIYKVANAYQKRFEEVEKDLLSGDPQLSNLTYARMIALEGLGRLENTDAIIDVGSGRVNLSKYDVVDGVKNYTEGYTTNEAMAFMQTDIKRFDVKGVAKESADSLGGLTEQYFTEAKKAGGVHKLLEKVNMQDSSELKGVKEGYQKWINDTVDSYMSDVQQASILVDFLQGQGYEAVTDKRKFDDDKTGKLLYIKPNGELEFQDGQKELARETLKNQIHYSIERKYNEKTAGTKQYAPTRYDRGTGKGLDADEVVNMLGYLYYGDKTMMDTATTYFRDAIPNVQEVDRQKDTLIVTFADGSSRDFKITGLTQQEFIEGATPLFAGEVDLTGAIGRARFDPNQVKTDFTSSAMVTMPQTDEQLAREYVRVSPVDSNLGSRELSNKLNSLFNVLGFKVEKWYGKVSITSPSGVEAKFQTDDVQGIKEFIQGNITAPNAASASEFMREYIEGIPTEEPTTEPTGTEPKLDPFGNPI